MKFKDNIAYMNLIEENEGVYVYTDRICSVVFEELITKFHREEVPVLSVFTKPNTDAGTFGFIGTVSAREYKFEGNDVILNGVKDVIQQAGSPILHEFIYVPANFYCMRSEILLRHQNNIPRVGDIYPQIAILNCYNGSGSKEINFGFSIYDGQERYASIGFKNKIGNMKQNHVQGSRTSVASISSYVERFNNNIVELFEQNYNNRLSDDDVLKTLDLIEKVGKRKRDAISKALDEISTLTTNGYVTSWNIFLAITKFSTIERNINVKALLENVAERVLILPAEMCQVLT